MDAGAPECVCAGRFVYDYTNRTVHRLAEKNFVPRLARLLRRLLGRDLAV